ncbi:transporter substrate-binding domain-containing protein [Maridesulfovibrio sp.]|uniref:substrate-binding periplasmic protein n=1 Tax=Maridesulfovibrio sp. TaxID=2795000 RepID=UPI0029CA9C97|nr:transporter substrate-binding domain-containing protein [Maridesulfovibrio sp.]
MKQFLSVFFTLFLLIYSSTTSPAQEIIFPVNHFPPWKMVDTQDRISGINIDIANLLLSQLGLKAKYINRPWKRCMLMIEQGTADIMNGLLKHPEREKVMIFLEPPYKTKSTKAFYVLKGNAGKIKSYEDLRNLNIGVTLGTKFFPRFDNDKHLKKDIASNAITNFKKLLAGRINTFILTETVGDYLLFKHGYQDRIEKAEYSYAQPIPVYFAVSPKSPLAERIPELNAALKKIVESGQVQKTIDNFMDNIQTSF